MGFDLDASLRSAEARLGRSARHARSDRGKHRMAPEVEARLAKVLGGQDRPPMRQVMAALAHRGARRRRGPPSRTAIYNFMARAPLHVHALDTLPLPAREALYNLSGTGRVPAAQVVFYCFNYGSLSAISFASGLPWIDLYQAARLRGWRPASLALLKSVMKARGL